MGHNGIFSSIPSLSCPIVTNQNNKSAAESITVRKILSFCKKCNNKRIQYLKQEEFCNAFSCSSDCKSVTIEILMKLSSHMMSILTMVKTTQVKS